MDVIKKKELLLQKKEKIKEEEKKLLEELKILNEKEKKFEAQAMIIFFKFLLKHNRELIDKIITSNDDDIKNYFIKKTKREVIDYRIYLKNVIEKEKRKNQNSNDGNKEEK